MQSKEKKNMIILRLFTDEDVNEKLIETCKMYKVKTAVVVSGIGQLKKAKLGYFKDKGDYAPETYDKNLEILSLTGNICEQNNEYIPHLHAILGNENKNAIGGHFIEGTVGVTAEIVLMKTDIQIERRFDDETGLKSLYLE
jgi:hypothetical protein